MTARDGQPARRHSGLSSGLHTPGSRILPMQPCIRTVTFSEKDGEKYSRKFQTFKNREEVVDSYSETQTSSTDSDDRCRTIGTDNIIPGDADGLIQRRLKLWKPPTSSSNHSRHGPPINTQVPLQSIKRKPCSPRFVNTKTSRRPYYENRAQADHCAALMPGQCQRARPNHRITAVHARSNQPNLMEQQRHLLDDEASIRLCNDHHFIGPKHRSLGPLHVVPKRRPIRYFGPLIAQSELHDKYEQTWQRYHGAVIGEIEGDSLNTLSAEQQQSTSDSSELIKEAQSEPVKETEKHTCPLPPAKENDGETSTVLTSDLSSLPPVSLTPPHLAGVPATGRSPDKQAIGDRKINSETASSLELDQVLADAIKFVTRMVIEFTITFWVWFVLKLFNTWPFITLCDRVFSLHVDRQEQVRRRVTIIPHIIRIVITIYAFYCAWALLVLGLKVISYLLQPLRVALEILSWLTDNL